jgi:peptidylprolyl isomerase
MARRLLIMVALVSLLAPTGCGDDDGSSGDEQAAGTQTAPPPAADETLSDTGTKPVVPRPTGSPPRKLVIEDIVKGKGPAAKNGSTVVVHYVGVNFSNGFEFDASWDSGSPFPVQLGRGSVIEGWEKGLVGIRKGGRRMLTIPPELGYGASGAPPDIPPNETLVFVVDAIAVEPG